MREKKKRMKVSKRHVSTVKADRSPPPSTPQMEQRGPAYLTTGQFTPHALGGRDQPDVVQNARHQAYEMRKQSMERHNKVCL